MKSTILHLAIVAAMVALAGCIANDQVTTITVQPDGSADWICLRSNIHSTLLGEKGAEELRRFVEEFDAHKDADYLHITECGGEVLEARWVRRAEPYANLTVARFPNWSALQNFVTIQNENGEVIAQAQFAENGNRRRLSLAIPLTKESKEPEEPLPTLEQFRLEQANSISETRIAVAGGRIIASRGFAVAGDQRSALVDPMKIRDLVKSASDRIELFLEWELSGE